MGGLMDYKARFYSPYLNHFIQPDSIITNLANPQTLNRFSYVNNRPINFNDPNGHIACSDAYDFCGEMNFDGRITTSILRRGLARYGVKLKGNWDLENAKAVYFGVSLVGDKISSTRGWGESSQEAFKSAFGKTIFEWGCATCERLGETVDADTIRFREFYGAHNTYQMLMNINLVIHEIGHMFENSTATTLPDGTLYKPARSSLPSGLAGNRDGMGALWIYQQSDTISPGEIFADMFVGWVQGVWALDIDGMLTDSAESRNNWMNQHMPGYLKAPSSGYSGT